MYCSAQTPSGNFYSPLAGVLTTRTQQEAVRNGPHACPVPVPRPLPCPVVPMPGAHPCCLHSTQSLPTRPLSVANNEKTILHKNQKQLTASFNFLQPSRCLSWRCLPACQEDRKLLWRNLLFIQRQQPGSPCFIMMQLSEFDLNPEGLPAVAGDVTQVRTGGCG